MKPSIGRMVVYRVPDPARPGEVREHPAVITRVHTDTCVNLQVLFDAAAAEPRQSVLAAHLPGNNGPSWAWPERV